MIPHPTIPIGELRLHDLKLLLFVGASIEILIRLTMIFFVEKKPRSLLQKEENLRQLQYETGQKRNLGISAFVETSKLERQVLAQEKQLADIYARRSSQKAQLERVFRNINLAVSLLIFILYYGVPVLELDGMLLPSDVVLTPTTGSIETAESFGQSMLFPLSYLGVGVRMSRWGLSNPNASFGALLVMWTSQATVQTLFEGIEALVV